MGSASVATGAARATVRRGRDPAGKGDRSPKLSPTPYFSIIIPVYNGADVVGRAIESVINQTDPDWELLAVDDGSTDASREVLRLAAADDPRIRTFSLRNSGGPARPRNAAIAAASGHAICLLDQDDWWLPDKLTKQRPLLDNPNVGIVYSDAWYENEGHDRVPYSALWGPMRTGEVAGDLISRNFIPALTAVVPASVARIVGPLHEEMRGMDDYHWWLRIAMSGFLVDAVPEPLAVYTVGEGNLSHDHLSQLRALEACLNDMSRSHPEWRPQLDARREELRRHSFDFSANRLAASGITGRGGTGEMWRLLPLVRTRGEAKRLLASAIPPRIRALWEKGGSQIL